MNHTLKDLIDAQGTPHQVIAEGEIPRIVSLVPSITELICDLGLAKYLVGRTGFCIHPKKFVSRIAKIGGTKDVNINKIRQLSPSHLIVNIDENEKPTVEQLAEFVPHIIVTHPLKPADNLALFRLLGGIFKVSAQAEKLCTEFEQALAKLQPDLPCKRVLYCIWKDPWMTVASDTYIAQQLMLRNWKNWQADSQKRYPVFEWNQTLLDEIDEVLLSTEPYRFTQEHADQLQAQLGKPVRLVDGEMLSWYGSRAITGLRYLAGLK
ncbi:MAG: helical backbone metal receptor [Undibacterium sp.]|nr:helical backbone metal receptor [Undibacterium sp.]